MIDRFLNWGDHGKPKSGKIKGRCQPPLAFIQGLKKDIYKRNISLLWVGREGYNEQTISFPMKWCVVWFSHFHYCGTQSKKTIIIKMIFWERFQETIEGIIQ